MQIEAKILEIRDEGTHIPAMAMRMRAADDLTGYYIHGRSGYPRDGHGIVLMALDSQAATVDPYAWPGLGFGQRTMGNAHNYITKHFEALKDGDVIDVRVILGETNEPAVSDRFYNFETGKHDVPRAMQESA